ncbi:hypothetical protein ACP4OV_015313 [Aristida adscensionis]
MREADWGLQLVAGLPPASGELSLTCGLYHPCFQQ